MDFGIEKDNILEERIIEEKVSYLPAMSMALLLLKKIGDGVFALEFDGSVSDLDPGLDSPELIPFLANVGVRGLKV